VILKKLKDFFFTGHQRSIDIKKNIVLLFILRGANIVISFFMVPLTLHYLTSSKYGIWVTLTSIINWFSFLDVGLGNGLRNKFVEAKTHQDTSLVKTYVSTTYFSILFISVFLFCIFFILNNYLPWNSILNTTEIPSSELQFLSAIIFFFFCLRFVSELISTILIADQKPASSSFLTFISNGFSFLGLYVLTLYSNGNLILAASILSGIPIVVLTLASIYLFLGAYKEFVPSMRSFSLNSARSLASLGVQFFVIQISGIILFSTSNIIITQLFGPSSVTVYNLAQRYIGVVSMAFTIILTPFWSAYTEAYLKRDFAWIQHTTQRLLVAWMFLVVCVIVLIIIEPYAYSFWLGDSIKIPVEMTLLMGIFAVISLWNSIFANFINGVGKIRLQFISSIVLGVVNIPLSLFLAKYVVKGPGGVILSTCLCLLVGSVWAPIQYKKIISGTAVGIWNS
jgi:O-antigen/teichoic acid export membrane protein